MCWNRIDGVRQVRRGVREVLGALAEMRTDGIGVNVVSMCLQVPSIFDAALREAVLPDGHAGFETE